MSAPPQAYGLWGLVLINSVIFIMFAFTFFKLPIPVIAIGCSDALRSGVPGDRDRCGAG